MVSLQLLGGCSIRADDRMTSGEAGQARRSALLVLLACARTGALTREKLIGFLWPEAGSDHARHVLSESLYQLRRALGPDVVLAEGERVRLATDRVSCDVTRFEAALADGELEQAVAIYAGPFLDGFYVNEAAAFERWVEAERGRLADAYATALEQLAHRAAATGDHVGAIGWWKRLIAHDPYASRYVIAAMEEMALADDPANALLLAEEHARRLREDLGVAPADELTARAARVREELAARPPQTTVRAIESHGDESPASAAATFASPRPTDRARRIAAILGACMVLAVTVLVVVRTAPDALRARAEVRSTRLAVLPFTYRGSGELAYLGESMSHLLSTTLDGFRDLRAIAPLANGTQVAAGGTSRSEWIRRVAGRLDADRVVTGEVVEVEGRVRITAWLDARTGSADAPATASVDGPVTDFHALTDDLARQLLVLLVGPVRELHSVAARTTDSLTALKAYLEGVAHRRAGRFDAAFAAFQRAVEIDSTFALAWHGMGVSAAWENMPEWDPGMDATVRAVRFSGSLPTHTRLVLRAYSAIMHGDGPETERLTRAVLSEYPHDVQAWFILAWAGSLNPFYGRPVSDVRDAIERAYRYDPYDPDHQSGAAWFATRDGNWARLDSLWGDGFPTRAVRAFGSGDSAAQRRVLQEGASADAGALSLASGWIAMTRRDLPAATRLARLAAARETAAVERALAHVRLAQLEWALGRWHAAMAALDTVARHERAWADLYRALLASTEFAPVSRGQLEELRAAVARWDVTDVRPSVTHTAARAHDILAPQLRLYAIGRLDLDLGDLDGVLGIADSLEAMGNPPAALTFAEDRAQSLRAHVAFQRGDYEDALAALEAQPRRIRIQWLVGGTPFYPCPEDRFVHGEILRRMGRFDEALRWYATIQDITPYDAHYLAAAHLRRAEIYERLQDAERAAGHYGEFIRLWAGGDVELQPDVGRARAALARLPARRAGLTTP